MWHGIGLPIPSRLRVLGKRIVSPRGVQNRNPVAKLSSKYSKVIQEFVFLKNERVIWTTSNKTLSL